MHYYTRGDKSLQYTRARAGVWVLGCYRGIYCRRNDDDCDAAAEARDFSSLFLLFSAHPPVKLFRRTAGSGLRGSLFLPSHTCGYTLDEMFSRDENEPSGRERAFGRGIFGDGDATSCPPRKFFLACFKRPSDNLLLFCFSRKYISYPAG